MWTEHYIQANKKLSFDHINCHHKPSYHLQELLLSFRRRLARDEIVLDNGYDQFQWGTDRRTENSVSLIHNRHSSERLRAIIARRSIKFGNADRGATPATPESRACTIVLPCRRIRVFASSVRLPSARVFRMRLAYFNVSTNTFQGKQVSHTINVHAATSA